MSSWFRNRNCYTFALFEHQVVLPAHLWKSRGSRFPYGEKKAGEDNGGHIFLMDVVHQRIIDDEAFSQYSVQRRGRTSEDDYYLNGERWTPHGACPQKVWDHQSTPMCDYDVVISFKAVEEAVLFKLMFGEG